MNREERRRQDKANRQQTGRVQKTIAPERLDAEIQDFLAGTIFAAGAAGVRGEGLGPDLPPLFVVLLDKKAFSPAPELLRLFALLESEGTVKLNDQLKGTARWGVIPAKNGQMLARLELNLTTPVQARPSFLLLADNYKDIWDIPATQGYVLGITTTDRFYALNESSSYADAMEASILLQPEPSHVARSLHEHYTAASEPFAPVAPPIVFFNGDEADDMRYQVGIASDPDGEVLYAFMLLCPTAVTQIPLGGDSVPSLIANAYAERGLHWFNESDPLKHAEGWSWKERGREFIITDAEGVLVASFEPETTGQEEQWLKTVRSTGGLVLNIGDERVMGDGMTTKEQIMAAQARGNVVTGVVLHVDAPAAFDREDPSPAPDSSEIIPEADNRPWWKRLFRA